MCIRDRLSPRLIAHRLQIQQLHGPVIGGAPFRGGHAALLQEKRSGRQGLLIARALPSTQKPGSRPAVYKRQVLALMDSYVPAAN